MADYMTRIVTQVEDAKTNGETEITIQMPFTVSGDVIKTVSEKGLISGFERTGTRMTPEYYITFYIKS